MGKVVYSYFHNLICWDILPFRALNVIRKMTLTNKKMFNKGKLNKFHKETYAMKVHLSIVCNSEISPSMAISW